jgi:hypothetical protein
MGVAIGDSRVWMAARHTGHVDRAGLLFHSDYRDLFDTPEKDLPFDWMLVCFRVFILTFGAAVAMKVWTIWHGG